MHSRDMSDAELMRMMATYAELLQSLSSLSRNEFFAFINRNEFQELGVCKALELVGEAANYVSAAGRSKYSEIDFDKWEKDRHDITHGYGGTDMTYIHQTIIHDIPDLCRELRSYGFASSSP